MSALDKQEGGGHYKGKAIQPVQYIHANGLGFCEGNVVKYITRWREKGGKADLRKVIHYVELLMELEGLVDTSEPAAQIDDESDRQKAVEQNGNDGAVYDDPWYGAPEWANYKAQDADGTWCWCSANPVAMTVRWVCGQEGNSTWKRDKLATDTNPNPDWRDTLISR